MSKHTVQGIEKKVGFPCVKSFHSELVKYAVVSTWTLVYITHHRALKRKDTSADSEFAA